MSEPQPSDATDVEPPAAPAASAEDRKAAAALSALDARGDDADAPAGKAEVDTAALGAAMNRLEMLSKKDAAPSSATKNDNAANSKKEPAKKVKVDAADVNMLVEHLELPKAKATELLRLHEGKVEGALEAWIKAGA